MSALVAAFVSELQVIAKEAALKASIQGQLLLEANKDPFLKGYVHPRSTTRERVPIMSADGKVVGFFTPRIDDGTFRVGAIYVQPEHRGKGLASSAVKKFMNGKKARAFVASDNTSSRKMLERAGFLQTDEEKRWGGGHWFRTPKEIEYRKVNKIAHLMHPALTARFVSEITKLAKLDPKRWDEVIVDAPHAVLTKKHVFNYYSEPKVKRVLLAELADRDAIIRQNFSKDQVVLKRKEKEKNIRISQHGLNVEDPKDLSYFTERRATEFHPVQKKMDTRVVVDLDPNEDFPFSEAKTVAGQVKDVVAKMPGIKNTHVRFSGGRGFYVVGHLDKPAHVDKVREQLKTALHPLTEADDRLTMGVPRKDQMRLDLSPMKENGSFRGMYSLNVATGLVSVPVKDLAAFDPSKHATMDAVLGRKPKEYRHAR